MNLLSWITGVGVPSLLGGGLLFAAALVWARVPGIGHHLGLALAIIGVSSIMYARGYSDRAKDDRSVALSEQVIALEEVIKETARLQSAHAEEVTEARTEAAENQRKADALLEQIRKTPFLAACDFTPVERDRLRQIPIGRPQPAGSTGQPRTHPLPRPGRASQPQGIRNQSSTGAVGVRRQAPSGR